MSTPTLNISEIFHSIQGESSYAGWPCTFIRLAGCGHGCRHCDTAYAEHPGREMNIEEIIERVVELGAPLVEITGGEPLLQEEVYPLMEKLCNRWKERVLLETGGFLSVAKADPRVHKIIDLKPPSTGVSDKNNPENIALALKQKDHANRLIELKIVVADREDYLWARELLTRTGLPDACTVMMGVAFGMLEPVNLANWILEDRLNVRMQLQLHKYIWDPGRRGV
ncbi:7-carboxy-7-deazaguanine synthase QueE [Chlorobium ferrooxidans]|uniref:7-carboxy-7-deazaguanine synthase n=1 Tax=Chlorobium ferrooxidans DSM 13031 TaxID=377431 RepID=Q0YUM3_9CHLB|nr:7-carboxy-7-deazaguanine synthase QueE [Chlorobium ferrooxidans]EAT60009.1 Radical SAM [Chlorobium ferrooxidans DSM 13031]